MTVANGLLDLAAGRLTAAADLADDLAPRADSTLMVALAGQIRLTAATLSENPTSPDGAGVSIQGELIAALAILDTIAPHDGPPDLQIRAWHVSELIRIVDETTVP